MANRYMVCALYIFTLHAVAMAGGYTKEGPADKTADKNIQVDPADPGAGPVADIDNGKKENSPSADSVKTNQENEDISIQKSLSFSSFHTGARSLNPDPYPGPVNLHPEPSRPLPYPPTPSTYPSYYNSNPGGSAPYPGQAIYPTTLYPGLARSSTPVSTDYVSRYLGPGTVPVVLPDGTIADTPEVVVARVAHLTALQKAQALWYGPQDDGSYSPLKYGDVHATGYPTPGPVGSSYSGRPSLGHEGSSATGYHGPLRANYPGPVDAGNPGPVAAGYPGSSATGHTEPEAPGYPGPIAAGYPGPVATGYAGPVVAGYPGPSPTGHTESQPSTYPGPSPTGHPRPVAPGFQEPLVTRYQGPLAMPTVLPSGYLADTPEVVAARTAHLTALVKALKQGDATYLRTASQKGWR